MTSLELNAAATAALSTQHSLKGSKCPHMLPVLFVDVQVPSLCNETSPPRLVNFERFSLNLLSLNLFGHVCGTMALRESPLCVMQLHSAFPGKIKLLPSFYCLTTERMDHKRVQGY